MKNLIAKIQANPGFYIKRAAVVGASVAGLLVVSTLLKTSKDVAEIEEHLAEVTTEEA